MWDNYGVSTPEVRYCECGCGTPLAAPAYPCLQRRFISGHNARTNEDPLRWDEDPSGCWRWQKTLNHAGYGVARVKGQTYMAHRAVYQRLVGSIPEGMQLDHLCRNRWCVNPAHMDVVTPAENTRRSRTAKLSVEQVLEIRRLATTGSLTQAAIAARFGISQPHVSAIKHSARWAT